MKPSRKRHQERRHFGGGQGPATSVTGGALDVREWRETERYEALVDFAWRTKKLKWSKTLFLLLLEELWVGDELDEIIGQPEKLPPTRHPQALAFAVALRHSWWPDDVQGLGDQLGVRRRAGKPRA